MASIISKTKGAMFEYSPYSVNAWEGCVKIPCDYCCIDTMCKRFKLYHKEAKLKDWLIDNRNAASIFIEELNKNKKEYQQTGLFFSIRTDVLLPQNIELFSWLSNACANRNIPIKILSKTGLSQLKEFLIYKSHYNYYNENLIAIGYTLTGRDDMERGCAPNIERIECLKLAKESGFKTWASIEPIIDFKSSLDMIRKSVEYVDLYKIGLESGRKYLSDDIIDFVNEVLIITTKNSNVLEGTKIYLKDSIVNQAGYDRNKFISRLVTRDYNIFNN